MEGLDRSRYKDRCGLWNLRRLASANYPLFKRQIIDGRVYIDGGVYKNIPIDLVKKNSGSKLLIVPLGYMSPLDIVDYVPGYGAWRCDVRVISPSVDPGDEMDFSAGHSSELLKMGYLDCLKAFERLYGRDFFLSSHYDSIEGMFAALSPADQRTALEMLELRELPGDIDPLFLDGSVFPLFRTPAADRLIESYASAGGAERLLIYDCREFIGYAVKEYIGTDHSNADNSELMDFLSYIWLKNAYNYAILSAGTDFCVSEFELTGE